MGDDTKRIQRLRRAFSEWRQESEGKPADSAEVGSFVDDLYCRLVATGDALLLENYPILSNLSAAFLYRFLPIPQDRLQPEFVYVPNEERSGVWDESTIKTSLFMTEWNICWEAGQARYEMFKDEVPENLRWLQDQAEKNLFLLPRGLRHRYYAYTSLFHMIPKRVLDRHGLPSFKCGFWPFYQQDAWLGYLIDEDFDDRLQRAFADLVWSRIDSGSGLAAFSDSYPLKLLAHNLDFWLPYSYEVAQQRLSQLPRVEAETVEDESLLREAVSTVREGLNIAKPRMGGYLWYGEEEAGQALDELVEAADAEGQLRAIIDAVRSNRVEDDFSDRWSFAKEDFERKLYKKRSKVSVTFVELDDTIPVHGPESEVEENLIWEDFLGPLNPKERQIVVLLRSGYTRLGDIAEKMGYANHSPVSKALAKIRTKAEQYLG